MVVRRNFIIILRLASELIVSFLDRRRAQGGIYVFYLGYNSDAVMIFRFGSVWTCLFP